MSKDKKKSGSKKCEKRCYKDDIAAKLALAKIENKDNPKRLKNEARIYWCKECRAYHLTSKKLKKSPKR